MLDWQHIDTVLLDMDGTLLDLHFDTHFWLEHVPLRYAEKHALDLHDAKQQLYPRFQRVEGTMEWYCLDYWSRQLGMDIAELKYEVEHLISIHPHVIEFLDDVRRNNKFMALVTNAHMKSLELKMERTRLGGHFDAIVCAHDFGLPKEAPEFWMRLQEKLSYEPARTLLVDDSLPVLRSAHEYGIKYLLAVYQPDTKSPPKDVGEFAAIQTFDDIMPVGG
jgi:putative hydrolase of the HAD superfamily